MNMTAATVAIDEYRSSGVLGDVERSDAHGLVNLLFKGAIDHMLAANGYIERKQKQEKAVRITKAIAILDGLRSSLNIVDGGEIAQNLDDLYDYMQRRLVVANADDDASIINEVMGLLREIQEAWNTMPYEARI
ncbi:MAG: flagellar export chaperone FliS [Gammaproteobacteria bacterium]|nr:flagellar export chaperone FliS [Gammaproteobacteria bacterium]NNC68658.1 flagellar export chaperone FliS [Gammaproteobacteria bacterium]